jgi:ABC-type polysaccharide/polyol phosphate transport system ATPase subunit
MTPSESHVAPSGVQQSRENMKMIDVDNVSIDFPLSFDVLPSAQSKMKVALRRAMEGKFSRRQVRKFRALDRVSFSAREGEVIGVIGPNGCGKTTLLRAISKVYAPDTGVVRTVGKMSTLLSLGTGFNNNLPGRANIYLAGYLAGQSKQQIDENFDRIVSFAGIEDHINVPVKYYSNGMISRLGFSIASSMDPEILLVDEIFSVGDLAFREKSEAVMTDLMKKAGVQVIVTHNLSFVRQRCTRALFLSRGQLIADGEPNSVVDEYEQWVKSPQAQATAKYGSRFAVIEYD